MDEVWTTVHLLIPSSLSSSEVTEYLHAQIRSIAHDARRADLDFVEKGEASELFPARPGPMCGWCDLRAHCPEGQAAGPEKSGWAALEEPTRVGGRPARDDA